MRVFHKPTGLMAVCQSRSQAENRQQALKILQAKLLEREQENYQQKRSQDRYTQIGSGNRMDRIRTYNFITGLVINHQINKTSKQIKKIMDGHLYEISNNR